MADWKVLIEAMPHSRGVRLVVRDALSRVDAQTELTETEAFGLIEGINQAIQTNAVFNRSDLMKKLMMTSEDKSLGHGQKEERDE